MPKVCFYYDPEEKDFEGFTIDAFDGKITAVRGVVRMKSSGHPAPDISHGAVMAFDELPAEVQGALFKLRALLCAKARRDMGMGEGDAPGATVPELNA